MAPAAACGCVGSAALAQPICGLLDAVRARLLLRACGGRTRAAARRIARAGCLRSAAGLLGRAGVGRRVLLLLPLLPRLVALLPPAAIARAAASRHGSKRRPARALLLRRAPGAARAACAAACAISEVGQLLRLRLRREARQQVAAAGRGVSGVAQPAEVGRLHRRHVRPRGRDLKHHAPRRQRRGRHHRHQHLRHLRGGGGDAGHAAAAAARSSTGHAVAACLQLSCAPQHHSAPPPLRPHLQVALLHGPRAHPQLLQHQQRPNTQQPRERHAGQPAHSHLVQCSTHARASQAARQLSHDRA
jgi:hypothetical protein